MLILQAEEEREVKEVRTAEKIKEAKQRLLLSMVEAGKRKAFMASVLHVDVEELDGMIKAARMEAYNKNIIWEISCSLNGTRCTGLM